MKIKKHELNKMNELLKHGYLKPITTFCNWFWGIDSFESIDGRIKLSKTEGRFLCAGIRECYGYTLKIDDVIIKHNSYAYLMKCTYNFIIKKKLIVF